MIRGFEDGTRSREPGALVVVGNRHALARELEDRLLERGSPVVRSRVSSRGALLPLVLSGAVVIAETANPEAVTITRGNGESIPIGPGESADEILQQLSNASLISRGDNA